MTLISARWAVICALLLGTGATHAQQYAAVAVGNRTYINTAGAVKNESGYYFVASTAAAEKEGAVIACRAGERDHNSKQACAKRILVGRVSDYHIAAVCVLSTLSTGVVGVGSTREAALRAAKQTYAVILYDGFKDKHKAFSSPDVFIPDMKCYEMRTFFKGAQIETIHKPPGGGIRTSQASRD